MPDKTALMPGIARKRWTKKKIIDLFNNSDEAKEGNIQYPMKSLSNKRLDIIITEICGLLSHNNGLEQGAFYVAHLMPSVPCVQSIPAKNPNL